MKNYTTIPDAGDILAKDRLAAMANAAPASAAHPLLTVHEILGRAYFSKNEWGTLTDYKGVHQQAAMDVQIDGGVYTVYCKIEDGRKEWSARCPSFRQHNAAAVIEAVQRRVCRKETVN